MELGAVQSGYVGASYVYQKETATVEGGYENTSFTRETTEEEDSELIGLTMMKLS